MELIKALSWANSFENFSFLTSGNSDKYPYGGFDNMLAVGNTTPITNLEELNTKVINKKWLFGHFGYDLKNKLEDLESTNPGRIEFGDLSFFEPSCIVGFKNDVPSTIYSNLDYLIEDRINDFEVQKSNIFEFDSIQESMTKDEYEAKFNQVRNHILEGDVYELNLCMEFYMHNFDSSPIEIFIKMLSDSPTPFQCLYKTNNKYVVSSSPELFIKKEEGKLISQPIKGTNKAENDDELNKSIQAELLSSEKERAENMMIVDLIRNDLAKSSMPSSVKVEEIFGVYKMNSVNQMISTVTSKKLDSIGNLECILNAFPMGSMTGAPKIEAMKLIDQLENTKRGIYAGSIGYFDDLGNFDFNVVIRSLLIDSIAKVCSFSVGGAITYDSNCEDEYKECLLKAEFLFNLFKENELQD